MTVSKNGKFAKSTFARNKFLTLSTSLLALLAAAPMAQANPSGGVVVGGSASITTSAAEVNIQQHSDRALIEWNNFDIAEGETTRFVQPSQTSIALNRVVNSNQVSKINGNLFANGRVIIVNPNGVLIGAQGNVDTAGFVATTADIDNNDFMNSPTILKFNKAGNEDGLVENNGTITVAETGLAALVAPNARNNGVINARLAKVQLAGADTFALDFYGDGLISYAVAKNPNKKRNIEVENNGAIIADGGVVTMTAADASDVIDTVINNKGSVQAQGLVKRNGEIILTGGGAKINVSGKLDVSAKSGGKAGTIKVGGDKQGQGTLAKAETVQLAAEALLMADAAEHGDGGTIIVWSDKATISRARYLARGGAQSGNGGFVETSSPLFLDVEGTTVNTLANFGNAGDWLLDPTNITIVAAGVAYNPANHSAAAPAGNVSITASTINSATSNVVLWATNDITFNASINMQNTGVGFRANAGNDIKLNGFNVITRKGAITLDAGDDIEFSNSIIDTNGASITLLADDDIELTNIFMQSDGSQIKLESYDMIINNLQASTSGGDFILTADGSLSDLFMDNTTINTTGGTQGGTIKVSEFWDGNVTTTEFGTGNKYATSAGGKGGKIDIYATDATNTNNNNCFSAGGAAGACVAVPNPIALTVTSGGTKVYGDADPAQLYTLSTPLLSGSSFIGAVSRALGENVGSYIISRGTLDIIGTTAYEVTYNFSNPFTITRATLNVLANAVSKVYGDADPVLTYAVNGFKFSDTASSVLTGGLSRAAGQNAGTYAITQGTLATNGNYTLNYSGNSFTITKATLNILANAVSKVYGDADPVLSYAANGFKFSDTASSVLTGALSRVSGQNVGTYGINQGTLAANNNYTLNFTGNSFTINKANLLVKADNKTKIYGDADPLLTVTFDGLKNGDTPSLFNVSTRRAAGENVGNYEISTNLLAPVPVPGPFITIPGGMINGMPIITMIPGPPIMPFDYRSNYNITTETGNFSITPTALSVVANAVSKVYGDADPVLTYTANGFKFADTIGSVLTGALTRAAGENAGLYQIAQGSVAANSNYTINYTPADFEILRKALTVRADAQSKIYGSADPLLTYTLLGLANGDEQEDFSFNITRELGENVGFYEILVSGLSLDTEMPLSAEGYNTVDVPSRLLNNYNVSFENGLLQITPKSLLITADNKTKVYGSADPSLSFTFDGLEYDDAAEDFDIAISRILGENVGNYNILLSFLNDTQENSELSSANIEAFDLQDFDMPIFIGKPKLNRIMNNYNIQLQNGNFQITPATLNVIANNNGKVINRADPALTFSASGFQFDDTAQNTLGGNLARQPGESLGGYLIGQGSLESLTSNYDLIFTPGLFTISLEPRTVFPSLPVGAANRPFFSFADFVFSQNSSFQAFNTNGTNVNTSLLSGAPPANTPQILNNLAPDAGDEASNLANLEPAAGGDETQEQQSNTTQNQSGNNDIDCGNSFLDGKPCDQNI